MTDTETLADALIALAAVRVARTRTKAQIAAVVAALRDNDMAALAECVIGPVPFDDEPALNYERFLQ